MANSYRIVMDVTTTFDYPELSLDMNITSDLVYQPPDRVQGVTITELAGETEEVEQIIIGETVYEKEPDTGVWRLATEPIPGFDVNALTTWSQDVEDLVLLGKETLDGLPVYHLQAVKKSVEDMMSSPIFLLGIFAAKLEDGGLSMDIEEYDLQIEYWIGTEDGRFAKNSVTGEMALAVSGPPGSGEILEMSYVIT